MSFVPKEWQVEPIQHLGKILKETASALDASFCGSGKTAVAAGICREQGWSAHVIAPKTTLPGWRRMLDLAGVEINELSSYERAIRRPLERKRGCLFVFDEVHRAANRKTRNAAKLIEAAHKGRVLMLSATAIQSPLNMGAIGPVLGLFQQRDYWNWLSANGCKKGFFGGMVFDGKESHLRKLHEQVFPHKGVCLDRNLVPSFPKCHEVDLLVDLGAEVNKVYKQFAKEVGVRSDEIFNSIDPELDLPITRTLRFRQAVEMAKIPALCELVEDYRSSGLAMVVALSFRESIKMMASQFPNCAIIQGGEDIESERLRFQHDKTDVCLLQAQAGGVGLDLHDEFGHRPRGLIRCPLDDARLSEQIEGRIRRNGSHTPATIFNVHAAGTVEDVVRTRNIHKVKLINTFNNG